MTEDEFDRTRNEVLQVLTSVRNEVGQSIWLDKRFLRSKLPTEISVEDMVAVVGSLTQLDYVEIDRDLKPRDTLQDFSNIRLTSAGSNFYEMGHRFVVDTPVVETSGDTLNATANAAWPGIPENFVLSTAKRVQIVNALREAEAVISSLSGNNEDRAQAHGYITAARILAETPEPPVPLIWELLNRANAIAGIASLLVAVIALFYS